MTKARRRELRAKCRRSRLHDSLISPEEAVAIGRELTMDALYRARDIARACPFTLRIDFNDWETMRGLSIIWNAGRVQGIREERRLRK